MKNLLCLTVIYLIWLPFSSSLLTKMACSVSGNGTCVDPFCFVTPVSSTQNAANFGCGKLTRPLNKLVIRQKFYLKLFSDFIPVDIFPDIEFCSFVKKSNKRSFFYSILKTMNEKQPGLIHQCPYQGKDFQIRNLALGASDLALWIRGEYKIVYTFFDDLDRKILRVSGLGFLNRN